MSGKITAQSRTRMDRRNQFRDMTGGYLDIDDGDGLPIVTIRIEALPGYEDEADFVRYKLMGYPNAKHRKLA